MAAAEFGGLDGLDRERYGIALLVGSVTVELSTMLGASGFSSKNK